MPRALATAVALLWVTAAPRAHQVDEYLQAARLALAHDRVTLELDLTPGIAVASSVVPNLDTDGDGTISPGEARAYGESVLSDVAVALDGQPLGVTLERVEVPTSGEMREGVGTIRLLATAPVAISGPGRRRLDFRNNHRPDIGAYLANALKPDERAIHVERQTRDPRQQAIQIDYRVDPGPMLRATWLLVGLAVLAFLVGRGRSDPPSRYALRRASR
jgi:hypothetical protein